MGKPDRPTGPVPGDADYTPPKAKKPLTAPEWFLTQGGRYGRQTARNLLAEDAATLADSQAGMAEEAGGAFKARDVRRQVSAARKAAAARVRALEAKRAAAKKAAAAMRGRGG